jgi:alpha-tubulin suppressor-like RCC1 family protein
VNLGDVGAQKVALGDTHSLILTDKGGLMTTGQNDKYQLGLDPE